MIFGMNLLVFIVLLWSAAIVAALILDFCRDLKAAWQKKHPKAAFVPKPKRENWGLVQLTFGVNQTSVRPARRRHAR